MVDMTTLGALADEERVRPQAMGATLAALEQRQLVERRAHPDDGRCVVMSVTTPASGYWSIAGA